MATGNGDVLITRPVRFAAASSPSTRPCTGGTDLGLGQRIVGPAIVEERETTAVIRPGWVATVAADGSLVAERDGSHEIGSPR